MNNLCEGSRVAENRVVDPSSRLSLVSLGKLNIGDVERVVIRNSLVPEERVTVNIISSRRHDSDPLQG